MTTRLPGFFERRAEGEGEFVPLERASSAWNTATIRGPAITLLLSRALEEQSRGRPDLRAVRATFDLHSAVPQLPLRTRSRVLRSGRRLLLAESELLVGDSVYARGRGLFLNPGGTPVAREPVGHAVATLPPAPDPALLAGAADGAVYWSEGASWTRDRAPHQHPRPKATWFSSDSLVAGERLTPFQLVSAVADMTNVVVNWGPHGISEINADVSMSLARMPEAGEVGVLTLTRLTDGGVSAGSALLFDRAGAIGMTTVSAIPTAGEPIDFLRYKT